MYGAQKLIRAHYIGWVGHHNLGDEVMWNVCRSLLPGLMWELEPEPLHPASMGAYVANPGRALRTCMDELRSGRRLRAVTSQVIESVGGLFRNDVGILGGGTLMNHPMIATRYKALRQRLGKPVPVFGTGVRSSEFWHSQSSWTDTRRLWVNLTADLPVIGVRGPLSKELLEDAGAKNVIVSGDPAVFLHEPLQLGSGEASRRRVGINCGVATNMWGSAPELEATLALSAKRLCSEGYEVRLFAVSPDDLPVCNRVARAAGQQSIKIVPALTTEQEFFREARNIDVMVAVKLHAGVLAAAAGVPFVMLEYRPKCSDFSRSIGWERFTYRTNAIGAKHLVDAVMTVESLLPSLRQELCTSMCRLKKQFISYVECLRAMLFCR